MSSQEDTNDSVTVTEVGRRLLHNPNRELVRRVYGGNYDWYRRCVMANFPGCDQEAEKE